MCYYTMLLVMIFSDLYNAIGLSFQILIGQIVIQENPTDQNEQNVL